MNVFRNLSNLLKVVTFLALFLVTIMVSAQNSPIHVSGKVHDKSGETIIGATIFDQKTKKAP